MTTTNVEFTSDLHVRGGGFDLADYQVCAAARVSTGSMNDGANETGTGQ